MLRYLSIQHLAVIDRLDMELDRGFNVLTGDTGAGKSILVEAVALLVGGRASADLVRTGEETASVQAVFEDGDREIVVRREVTAQGRSRAFVDGALATAGTLRELGLRLVEVHGQHEHQELLDAESHLDLLDAYAALGASRDVTAAAYDRLKALQDELAGLQTDERQKAAKLDLLAFQRDEIQRAGPRPGEDVELLAAKQVLASAERVQRLSAEAYSALYESDGSALAQLAVVWKRLGELSAIDATARPYWEARESVKSQLEDLAFFLRGYADAIEASPARLQEVEDRLALLERLKRKYGPGLDDVIEHHRNALAEIEGLEASDRRAADLEGRLVAARADFARVAGQLRDHRHAAAKRLSRDLVRLLGELAMARTRFEVRFQPLDEAQWGPSGIDAAEFFLSPNPGEELRPLARIASGGELSRIMLALRTLSTRKGRGATLIFDEVDAGIGGQVADTVGRRLCELGADFQVVCITHLPQIAAYGDCHHRLSKHVENGRTITRATRLARDERVAEIGRLIAGDDVSASVQAGAVEMLDARAASEKKPKDESERPGPGESESRRRSARP